jgi:Sulfotransferase family
MTPRGFFDVSYEDFVADPVGTAESVYAYFGLPLSGVAVDAMREVHGRSVSGQARPAHRYSLEDFGLTGQEVDERFAGYPHVAAS